MQSISVMPVSTASTSDSTAVINIEALCRTQNERLKRFIQKRIWNREDAEDVLQLTYLEAMRCKDRFNGGSKPETWLFGIAVNLTRNYFKRHYGQPQLDEMTDALLSELQSEIEDDPGMLVEHERMLDRAVAAMDDLPDDIQSMFQLIVDAEYSYQDTADHVGVPIGTIRSRLSRARQSLKRHMEM
ncbi:RNA polymerase sigma factor [Pokkaliibacter plantistimulans]|uniref:RNA polymerase sigma factor n=1 Tax=Pokkaliibacter plantistimulans TaxID=1635171 RepID=A0ABX5M4R2_9GAMM|nr:RNA polymerase sigma factor [Pokkaliibacter plantistimulans]PXF32616.1 RNA polymerase sigma factor [Pokkaliibacter plantistimulans]